ncbi:hypothetical protein SAMN04488593_1613 [Microbacterium azadirachtae]|nr:hypothetical protein SAMN04488593_1613 [Microbacterium azadirachtae]SEF99134.1 hypothetical protein SAMN04488594_1600 [Microbacterium azadirachtae]SEG01390.1 hypothetical protein SAMN04488592_1610 [Microbacterium azadirachtae]
MVGQDSRSRAGAGVRIAGPVGTNKRYPYLAAQRAEENELRKARKAGPLQSLTDIQIRSHTVPITHAPRTPAMWGHAWVRFGDVDVRCVVRILRWTPDAVGVAVPVDEEWLRCWIWQGAVQRLENRTDAWM